MAEHDTAFDVTTTQDDAEAQAVEVPPPSEGEASHTPCSLTVLTASRGNASKQIIAGANGLPIKGHASLAITKGVLQHVQVAGLRGLQTLLGTVYPNQALVHGIVKASSPGDVMPFVTTEALKRAKPGTLEPGTVARSLEYIAYPNKLFLLMLDRDDNPEDPTKLATADELLALLAPLVPGLAAAGAVVTCSTSSAIRAKKTGEWLTPPQGFHVYLLAQGDLPRFVEALTVRLWNAGHGYCKLATANQQTGVAAVLMRAAVDLSVFSPERLDYVAGARIDKAAPFYQERGEPRLLEGGILDLDGVPDVTPEERQDFTERVAAAKAALAPERFQHVKATIVAAEPTLPPAQVEALAHQRLQHHEDGFLPEDLLLYFFHRKTAVPVSDLSAAYDGLRLADPHEPTYRDGTDAIFHWRQGDWCINSFAHGLRKIYRAVPTPPPDPDEEDMQNLLQQAPATGAARPSKSTAGEAPPDSVLAKAIAQDWNSTMVFDLQRQTFLRYGTETGIFHELDELETDAALTAQLERRLPDGFYTKTLRNVKYLLRSALHTRMASGPSTLVPFTNGVLDVATQEWHDHSPDFRLTWRLPYAYDPHATCPKTQAWLAEACRGRADQIEVLRAFLRAVLCGRTDVQRFPELVGPGGSGKGTFTRLAQGLVGLENVAVTELKHLESNRFETSNLIHKRLIVITDAEQWGGQITTLKALTGGDSIRVERKHVQKHPTAVAEGLVLISANEAITSADYTSGLDRRRIPIPFQHKPSTWRNLLEIKGNHFEGELAEEIPGALSWVLAMPEEEMLRYLLHTSTVAPTLAASHARALVRTNPLAAWADEHLTLDLTPGEPVEPKHRHAGVKVGVARLAEQGNRYECEDDWLYPNYVAYCDSTNTKPVSLRRFTDLLLDLLTAQLHLDGVEQRTTSTGSRFFGIRFRQPSDNENVATEADAYRPQTPFLVTGVITPAPRPTALADPSSGEGSVRDGEGWCEGLNSVDYGSEGSMRDFPHVCMGGGEEESNGTHIHQDDFSFSTPLSRARSDKANNPSHPSLPALAGANPSPDSSPTPHHCFAEGVCPQCHCTNLLVLGAYRKCPICSWKGLAKAPGAEVTPSASLPPEESPPAARGNVSPAAAREPGEDAVDESDGASVDRDRPF